VKARAYAARRAVDQVKADPRARALLHRHEHVSPGAACWQKKPACRDPGAVTAWRDRRVRGARYFVRDSDDLLSRSDAFEKPIARRTRSRCKQRAARLAKTFDQGRTPAALTRSAQHQPEIDNPGTESAARLWQSQSEPSLLGELLPRSEERR